MSAVGLPFRPELSRGAVLGLVLGVNGWVLGFALAVLAAGRPRLLVTHALPGALVSSTLALLLLAAVARARRRRPEAAGRVQLGGLLLVLGLLLAYVARWIEPVLAGDPGLARVLDSTASVRHVSLPLAGASLVAGVLVLASTLRRRRARARS